MAPPVYADVGKPARDLFSKGYHFGMLKLECKTKTPSGVEFTADMTNNSDTNKVAGNCEVKFKVPEYGLSVTDKWNTDNQIHTEAAIEDQVIKGLKLTGTTLFSPFSGKWSVVGKMQYKQPNATLTLDADVLNGPALHGGLVLGYSGLLAGYQASYDAAKAKLTKSNVLGGYETKDYYLHMNVDNGQDIGGSIYTKVSPKLEAGVQFGFTMGPNSTRLAIGCKYALDDITTLRAKVNNNCQLGLSYQQKLRPGVTVTGSTLLDMVNLNQGGHKVGVCLEMEA
ncbi:unnamed protein product [Darwinula stevensoni]|uniref:Voltage-dependent anion-selective channel n=1 Tax=Darwinula stevensoni TaxID=69355 RepID=A0A7R8X8B7_9CRUS|nr:unnamed protein product [Darwinula stevensoni]CAG0889947.1 unnamed protein product [Darwinula stevensoni]